MPQIQLVAELPGHAEAAWCVAFNPARSLLASCSTDKTVRLYNYSLGEASSSPDSVPAASDPRPKFHLNASIPTDHKRTVRYVAWAPTGRTFATASFDSTVGVWEEVEAEEDMSGDEGVVTGGGTGQVEWECVTALEGHENECKGVAFSQDGGLLASCSRDRSVWVWEVQPDADFECIAVMMDHGADVKCVAWHTREEILASASYDAHIHLMYDDPDGDWCLFQKLSPSLPAADLHITSATPALLLGMSDTEAEKAATDLVVPPLQDSETVWSLAWSPCGRFLASGGDRGGIRLWARTGSNPDSEMVEVVHTSAHRGVCYSLSWGTGGEEGGAGLLASAGGDGRIIVWQIKAVEGEGCLAAPMIAPVAAMKEAHGSADINSVVWNIRADGKGAGMLASAADDGSVKVWRIAQD